MRPRGNSTGFFIYICSMASKKNRKTKKSFWDSLPESKKERFEKEHKVAVDNMKTGRSLLNFFPATAKQKLTSACGHDENVAELIVGTLMNDFIKPILTGKIPTKKK